MIEIPLTQGKVALVSDEDADLAEYKWCCQCIYKNEISYQYAVRRIDVTRVVSLHRTILERALGRIPARTETIEHIDGNMLNNQRTNLRYCDVMQRQQRSKLSRNNTSGYRGCHYFKQRRVWKAQIGKRSISLGLYTTAEQAARAYDRAAIEMYGEHAQLNFPLETYA